VFEEVLGIPAHPLLVHAAVVFVPLQVLAAFAYALVPFVRRFIAWLVIGIAVIAPLTALFAKLSGDAFRDRLVRKGTSGPFLVQIDQHSSYGTSTLFASIGLSVLMIVLMIVQVSRSRPAVAQPVGDEETSSRTASLGSARGSIVIAGILTVAVLVVGAATGYFVFKTGDTGAHMVWSGQ
jgi:uncharacterized membrane protein